MTWETADNYFVWTFFTKHLQISINFYNLICYIFAWFVQYFRNETSLEMKQSRLPYEYSVHWRSCGNRRCEHRGLILYSLDFAVVATIFSFCLGIKLPRSLRCSSLAGLLCQGGSTLVHAKLVWHVEHKGSS